MAGGTTVALPTDAPKYSLETFFREAWPIIEPKRPLDWNWHLAELCRVLEAFHFDQLKNADGETVRRLAINIAPGFTKSMLCSVAYPTWCLSLDPSFEVITASNAMNLATRDSLKSNELVKSSWFQERWGSAVVIDKRQDVKTNWMTKAGGRRVATSPYSRFTGWRADEQVWDDLLDADDRHSKGKRDHALEWATSKMSNRLNDERTGKILCVGQRLHPQDHFGRKKDADFPGGGLQERESWDHLIIANMKEAKAHKKNTITLDDPRELGDFLHPTRYAEKEWAKTKEDLGTRGRKCQHQQDPSQDGGGLFKRHWWKRFETVPRLRQIVLSVDASFGAKGKKASWVVISAWGIGEDNHFYLLDQYRRKSDFVDSWKAVKGMAEKWKANAIVIENKANGPAIIAFLRRRGIPGIIEYPPKGSPPMGSKESRWNAVSPVVESGMVHVAVAGMESIMDRKPWTEGDFGAEVEGEVPEESDGDVLIDEAADCPDGDSDDTVDAMAQVIDWVHLRHTQVRVHTGQLR